jgi:hypothetical protein
MARTPATLEGLLSMAMGGRPPRNRAKAKKTEHVCSDPVPFAPYPWPSGAPRRHIPHQWQCGVCGRTMAGGDGKNFLPGCIMDDENNHAVGCLAPGQEGPVVTQAGERWHQVFSCPGCASPHHKDNPEGLPPRNGLYEIQL